MFAYDEKSIEAITGPAREMFEQWVSFFPTAPLFGVEWRFAGGAKNFPVDLNMFMPGMSLFTGYTAGEAAKPAAAKPAVAPKTAPKTAPVAAPKTAPVAAPKAAPAAPKAVKPTPVAEAVVTAKAPEKAPKPVAVKAAEKAAIAAPVNDGGSVVQIRGIGPRLAEELAEMGITTVAQIAALSRSELAKIDANLTSIKGRCFRDDWVGQAKALMAV